MSQWNARVSYRAGETIIRQGEQGDCAYVIESGRVEIVLEKPDGRQQRVGTRGVDTMIGEMALVDDAPRTATVRALEDCCLLRISKEDFSRRLLQADPVLRLTTQVILNRYRDILATAEIASQDRSAPAEALERGHAERGQVIEGIRLCNDLRAALENDGLELHYQPIVSANDGALRGFEALMRWRHPVDGLIPPDVFIPLAETSGLIIDVTRWAIHAACAALSRLKAALGRDDLYVSVNISSADLASQTILNDVWLALKESGLERGQLHLEITERMLMDQPERARAVLRAFRMLGVVIALDDFGTGYSSLGYLNSLEIDVLKIDRSFIAAMNGDQRSLELVRAIVGLGKSLGLQVVAEGVETSTEAEGVARLGFDSAQGYFFARPRRECEIAADVRRPAQSLELRVSAR
jgi:EAL domain-containing protein (putative c-di-GMP-specific phosphodiesterase class I)